MDGSSVAIAFLLRWEETSLFVGDMEDRLCDESGGWENLERMKRRRKERKEDCEGSKSNEKKEERVIQIRILGREVKTVLH